jgi:hypothetical protein
MCADVSEEHIAAICVTEDPSSESGSSMFPQNRPPQLQRIMLQSTRLQYKFSPTADRIYVAVPHNSLTYTTDDRSRCRVSR